MNQRYVDELRQKYIKNPPEGMTPKLVRNMTDSDLLDATCRKNLRTVELDHGLHMFEMLPKESLFAMQFFLLAKP